MTVSSHEIESCFFYWWICFYKYFQHIKKFFKTAHLIDNESIYLIVTGSNSCIARADSGGDIPDAPSYTKRKEINCQWSVVKLKMTSYFTLSHLLMSNSEEQTSGKEIVIGTINSGRVRVRFMVFNATFNNISAISRRSVLLVEE